MLIELNAEFPQPHRIKQVAAVIEDGGIVVYPTDTVYAVGCSLHNRKAIEKIYHIKRMNKFKPVSIICANIAQATIYAEISNLAFRMIRRVVPGSYTFVLPSTREVPKLMLTRQKTVGVRIPDSAILMAIVQELGSPIASTSIVDYDGEFMDDPFEIDRIYSHEVDLVVDGGLLTPVPSTMVDFTSGEPEITRYGKGDPTLFG